ncbi:MAG: hypothetical protein IJW88_07450 [Alistipes sp.]|nr:hypothetical protein [Rikenellaceae bacterium]MBQ7311347.1 hypothetical protein [Alistipes sp.]
MKRIWEYIKKLGELAKKYISPVFISLFVASFTLWYIAKLNYNYTTDLDVKIRIGDQRFEVPCVVEGKGTNLFGYVISTNRLNIPLSELEYTVMREVTQIGAAPTDRVRIHLQSESLKNAISVRLSDINIRSIGAVPDIEAPKDFDK